jgi:hypothetical protein
MRVLKNKGLIMAFMLLAIFAQSTFAALKEDPKAHYFNFTYDGTEFRIKVGEHGRAILCYNYQHPYSGEVHVPFHVTDPSTGTSYELYHVEQFAFENCTGLTRLEFEDGITDLGHDAFHGCSNLETLVFSNSIQALWKGTFIGCTSLTTIAFGKSNKAFEKTNIFSEADNITTCYCYDKEPRDIADKIGEGKYITDAADPFVEIGKKAVLYVPYGTREAYKTKRGWQDFQDIREFVLLDEDKTIDLHEAVNGLRVVFRRKIKEDKWNSFCAPMAFTADEITEVFGAGTQVLAFSPETTEKTLKFYTTTTMEANVPYMVKPTKSWPTYVFETKDIALPQAGTVASPAYTFTGVFDNGFVPQGSYFLSSNKYYKATKADSNPLKGYRTYLSAVTTAPAKALSFMIMPMTTAIEDLNTDILPATGNIYSIDGRLVRRDATSTDGLPKGLYIMNGKKVIVK